MTQIVLSIGSNLEREKHICFAIARLGEEFGGIEISPVYETQSVGFDGPDFFNLVVVFDSELSLSALVKKIRQIELEAGRERGKKTFSSRNLDIDILLVGDVNLRDQGLNIPRNEIENHAYVLKPLVDMLPTAIHPVIGLSYQAMWDDFKHGMQGLCLANFDCAPQNKIVNAS